MLISGLRFLLRIGIICFAASKHSSSIMNSLHQGAPNSILLIPVISSVIALPDSNWGSVLPTGLHLDLQTFLSIEDCLLLCWRSSRCQSVNYYRLPTACELNMGDRAGVDGLQELPGSIYSEKLSWNEVRFCVVAFTRMSLASILWDKG